MKTASAIKITKSGNMYYASWRDAKTGELRFVMEPTMIRAIAVATFITIGV